jgi:hypothetical protein
MDGRRTEQVRRSVAVVAAPRMRTKRALCFFCLRCDIPPGNEVDMTGSMDYALRKPHLDGDDAPRMAWDTSLS